MINSPTDLPYRQMISNRLRHIAHDLVIKTSVFVKTLTPWSFYAQTKDVAFIVEL